MSTLQLLVLVGLLVGLGLGAAAPAASAHTGVAVGPCPPSYPLANMPAWVEAHGTAGPPGVPLRSSGHVDLVVRNPAAPSSCTFIGLKWAV